MTSLDWIAHYCAVNLHEIWLPTSDIYFLYFHKSLQQGQFAFVESYVVIKRSLRPLQSEAAFFNGSIVFLKMKAMTPVF